MAQSPYHLAIPLSLSNKAVACQGYKATKTVQCPNRSTLECLAGLEPCPRCLLEVLVLLVAPLVHLTQQIQRRGN